MSQVVLDCTKDNSRCPGCPELSLGLLWHMMAIPDNSRQVGDLFGCVQTFFIWPTLPQLTPGGPEWALGGLVVLLSTPVTIVTDPALNFANIFLQLCMCMSLTLQLTNLFFAAVSIPSSNCRAFLKSSSVSNNSQCWQSQIIASSVISNRHVCATLTHTL